MNTAAPQLLNTAAKVEAYLLHLLAIADAATGALAAARREFDALPAVGFAALLSGEALPEVSDDYRAASAALAAAEAAHAEALTAYRVAYTKAERLQPLYA